ncbi:MAG TPA: hypothetical protein VI864_02595 [Candidatus Bathyarchaeia archaeon]|nr:hypothetical protein [Candidatus Bathyarchaeia archaeon]
MAYGSHPGIVWVGLDANKPTAGKLGRFAFATDTGTLYRDTGTGWAVEFKHLKSLTISGMAIMDENGRFLVDTVPSNPNAGLGTDTYPWNFIKVVGLGRFGWVAIGGTIVITSALHLQNVTADLTWLSIGGTSVITASRVLQNVTTSASIITSGGVTADVPVAKVGGGTRTLHFVNSKYTGYTDS